MDFLIVYKYQTNYPFTEQAIAPDGTLFLSNVTAFDSGVYECMAENEVASEGAIRHLNVLSMIIRWLLNV